MEANKEQLIVDKVSEIQKENRILLKKMLTIDLKPTKHNPQKIKIANTPSAYSLNRAQRIRELTRVTQENKMLLQRLQSAHSVYNHNKWEADHKKKSNLVDMLCKNADRYCQHPYFVMASEPRVFSATSTAKLGYSTMPSRGNRARSNYSVARRSKKRKRRLFTAGHEGRKRSEVGTLSKTNRPITAKAPIIGRRTNQTKPSTADQIFRPETVPFTNLGPLGETEPADEDDKIKQEITREVSGESDQEIEARIGNEEVKEDQEEEAQTPQDKFNERPRHIDNFSEEGEHKRQYEEADEHDNNQEDEGNHRHRSSSGANEEEEGESNNHHLHEEHEENEQHEEDEEDQREGENDEHNHGNGDSHNEDNDDPSDQHEQSNDNHSN